MSLVSRLPAAKRSCRAGKSSTPRARMTSSPREPPRLGLGELLEDLGEELVEVLLIAGLHQSRLLARSDGLRKPMCTECVLRLAIVPAITPLTWEISWWLNMTYSHPVKYSAPPPRNPRSEPRGPVRA